VLAAFPPPFNLPATRSTTTSHHTRVSVAQPASRACHHGVPACGASDGGHHYLARSPSTHSIRRPIRTTSPRASTAGVAIPLRFHPSASPFACPHRSTRSASLKPLVSYFSASRQPRLVPFPALGSTGVYAHSNQRTRVPRWPIENRVDGTNLSFHAFGLPTIGAQCRPPKPSSGLACTPRQGQPPSPTPRCPPPPH